MLQLKNGKSNLEIEEYTVIIPGICVGNAAQLACDLLISSKQLKRVGSIAHAALIPVYGPPAFEHDDGKVAGCELYESDVDKLLVIQFRAPLISRHTNSFHKWLAELLQQARRVVVLSASFGFEKRVIEESPYAYCASDTFKAMHDAQLNSNIVKWKEFTGETIFGGGNGLQLYRALERANIPTMLLFRYLLEGDNSTDALLIIRELNEICDDFLQLGGGDGSGRIKLTVPKSWNLLFGNDTPELLF